MKLLKTNDLIAHECTDEKRIEYVINRINKLRKWTDPVIIDRETYIIMDGHHRVMAAKRLGLKSIPCYVLDYSDNSVNVVCWKTGKKIDTSIITDVVDKGILLPKKSTKHVFNYDLKKIEVDLEELLTT